MRYEEKPGNPWGLLPCPFCGGDKFRVTERGVLDELYMRKGSGAMTVQCKRPGCGATLYQQQKEVDGGPTDYDSRLMKLVAKWNRRAGSGD